MGENQGMMWLVIAGLGVIGGTLVMTQSVRDSLMTVEKQVKSAVVEVVNNEE